MIPRLNLLSLILSILMLTACSQTPQQRLRHSVEETAHQCPITLSEGIVIDNVVYHDNIVTYTATVTNPILSISALQENSAAIKPLLIAGITQSDDPKVQAEVALWQEAQAQLRIILRDDRQSITIDLDSTEL